MRAEYYADLYRQYATFIKAPKENRPLKIASGAAGSNVNWTEVLMSQATKHMDAISLHYYTLPTGKWDKKGSSTQFGEAEWVATLAQTLRMDELIRKHSAVMDRYDPEKRVGLLVDEWGTWYDVEPGTEEGFLYQQNSLRDAVVAAINLNIFHHHADRVRMSNIAQMINVLQAMILTDKEKMLLTPTYHVFEMYRPFKGATSLPVSVSAPQYQVAETSVPALHASAARGEGDRVYLAITNLDPRRAAEVTVNVSGARLRNPSGRVLTAPQMNAINTFEKPDAVKPAAFTGARARGGALSLQIPAKSVVVVEASFSASNP
jgi:alpha-N-arabinofuranosidase